MPNEQMAINAQMAMQGKGGNLSDKQIGFAQDIVSSFQMTMQLTDWEKQFGAAAPPPGQPQQEKGQPLISNPPPAADTAKKAN